MGEEKPIYLVTKKGSKPRSFLKKIRPCPNCGAEMEKSGKLLTCPKCGTGRVVYGSPVKWVLKEKFQKEETVEELKERFGYNVNPAAVSPALEDLYEAIENFEEQRKRKS